VNGLNIRVRNAIQLKVGFPLRDLLSMTVGLVFTQELTMADGKGVPTVIIIQLRPIAENVIILTVDDLFIIIIVNLVF